MSRSALRNLFSRPATRRYPASVREPFAATRGRIEIDFPACIFCGACQRHCPAAAIVVSRAGSSWRIDRLACVICGACVIACPKKCLAMSSLTQSPVAALDTSPAMEEHCRPEAPAEADQSAEVPAVPEALAVHEAQRA